MKLLVILLLFTSIAIPQTIADINGMSKFYVIGNQADREKVVKILGKRLQGVTEDEAEFFLEYRELSRDSFGFYGGVIARGQMDAFIKRGETKVVVWSASASGGGYKSAVAGELAGKFLKALNPPKSR